MSVCLVLWLRATAAEHDAGLILGLVLDLMLGLVLGLGLEIIVCVWVGNNCVCVCVWCSLMQD